MTDQWLNQVFCEDALSGLARIPDGSIDLILTDPPYNLGKVAAELAYGEGLQAHARSAELRLKTPR